MKFSVLNRKVHKWGGIVIVLPLLIIALSGMMLQFKKEAGWIQPATQKGEGTVPTVSFEMILEAARSVPEAAIETWDDVDRLDVRPGKGMVKVRANNSWEIQIDTATGDVLQKAYRRSDLFESIHDGTFFHDGAKLYFFFPVAIVLFVLLITGIYIFFYPLIVRNNKANHRRSDS